MLDDFLRFAGYVLAGAFILYGAARIVTAAYFKSKQDHEAQPLVKGR